MLLILGDSHVIALRGGFERLTPPERNAIHETYGEVKFQQIETANNLRKPFFKFGKDRLRLRGRARRALKAATSKPNFAPMDDRNFLFCAGFHNATAIAGIAAEFTIDPAAKDKSYLSQAAFRSIVLHANSQLMIFYMHLREMGVRFAVLASPPVPATQVARYRIAPKDATQLIFMIERAKAITAEQLAAAGIHYVLPPADVTDHGFLRDELAARSRPDDDHGNALYGEIFLRHVFQSLRTADFWPKNA